MPPPPGTVLNLPPATPILSPPGVMNATVTYVIKSTDTFSSIATTFGQTLLTVAEAAASVPALFAPTVSLTVSDVPDIAVPQLLTALLNQTEFQNASGMVSRFLLSGLKIPSDF